VRRRLLVSEPQQRLLTAGQTAPSSAEAAPRSCVAASLSTSAASRQVSAASEDPTFLRSCGHCIRKADEISNSAATDGGFCLLTETTCEPPTLARCPTSKLCVGRGATMLSTCVSSTSGRSTANRSGAASGEPAEVCAGAADTCAVVTAATCSCDWGGRACGAAEGAGPPAAGGR